MNIVEFYTRNKKQIHLSLGYGGLCLLVGLLLMVQMYWLALIVGLSALVYILLNRLGVIYRLKNIKGLYYLLFFVLILCVSIMLRLFVLEMYAVPSNSMEKSILTGDKILVSKLAYGPRLPASPFEIPWLNIGFMLNKKARAHADSVWWPYKRFNGHGNIKHNDIVVFDAPFEGDMVIIKRCMGLPGDTLIIDDEQVIANGKKLVQAEGIQYTCRIETMEGEMLALQLKDMGAGFDGKNKGKYYATLNPRQIQQLRNSKSDYTISLDNPRNHKVHELFPFDSTFFWKWDQYGPVVIPHKGMTIALNKKNWSLYKKNINYFENGEVAFHDQRFYKDGQEINTYTFHKNYYWMMGDYRKYSDDSRRWGFVPEDHIIGKAWLVVFSNRNGDFRWERVLKKLN